VLAFNALIGGRPAILAHVYGRQPASTSRIIVFHIRRTTGTYGTLLTASVPESLDQWGHLTHFSLDLHRDFTYRGRRHSYLSAACPAPPGFPGATFTLARAAISFADGRTLVSTLTRGCRVRRDPPLRSTLFRSRKPALTPHIPALTLALAAPNGRRRLPHGIAEGSMRSCPLPGGLDHRSEVRVAPLPVGQIRCGWRPGAKTGSPWPRCPDAAHLVIRPTSGHRRTTPQDQEAPPAPGRPPSATA
jgi:hypothetical protein